MGPTGDIILTLNNYFYDLAAAFLAVGLAVLWTLLKRCPVSGEAAPEIAFVRAYQSVVRIVRYSLCWIVIASAAGTLFSNQFGSSDPGDLRIVAQAVKGAGIFSIIVLGLFPWLRLSKKVGYLKSKHNLRA